MKAAIYRRYGGPEVIEIAEVPKPVPKDGEALVRVHAATVTSLDCRQRSLGVPRLSWLFQILGRLTYGIWRPSRPILGREFAGIVETYGKGVSSFKKGDAVFASLGITSGAYAEFVVMPADKLIATKPENMSFEEAAALVPGGIPAAHSVRAANIKSGETVLVLGASGVAGSAVVQIAAGLGAVVTGASRSKHTRVGSLSAAKAISYLEFSSSTETYDVIVSAAPLLSFRASKRRLNAGGRFVALSSSFRDLFWLLWPVRAGGKRMILGLPVKPEPADMRRLAELATAGMFRPVIDRVSDLDAVRHAHSYVESGRPRGNVVVKIAADVIQTAPGAGWLGIPSYEVEVHAS